MPLGGVLTSAAGAPLQQARGNDSDRAAQDVSSQQRGDKLGDRADAAAGVGQTEEDQGSAERDADGRRMWERSPEGKSQQENTDEQHQPPPPVKDPTGNAGNALDLTG
jgi:hypothetical protein